MGRQEICVGREVQLGAPRHQHKLSEGYSTTRRPALGARENGGVEKSAEQQAYSPIQGQIAVDVGFGWLGREK